MKFIAFIPIIALSSIAHAVLSPEQTIVSIANTTSQPVELRIKAEFTDAQGNSTKGGGVRIVVQPGRTEKIDLKGATQRFRETAQEGQKGAVAEERPTLRKINESQLVSVKILKIVALSASGANLFKIFTQEPKKAKKKTIVVISEYASADTLTVKQDQGTGRVYLV